MVVDLPPRPPRLLQLLVLLAWLLMRAWRHLLSGLAPCRLLCWTFGVVAAPTRKLWGIMVVAWPQCELTLRRRQPTLPPHYPWRAQTLVSTVMAVQLLTRQGGLPRRRRRRPACGLRLGYPRRTCETSGAASATLGMNRLSTSKWTSTSNSYSSSVDSSHRHRRCHRLCQPPERWRWRRQRLRRRDV